MRRITKAVFPVAGFGTRFLPATKAMPKELLPIIDKPLIQYAVEEAILAGIDTLIFITGRNKRAIEDHFDSNLELEYELKKKGKYAQAEMIQNILPSNIECVFLRQSRQLGLGHAILCAERIIGNEAFAVLLADDFITDTSSGVTSDLINAYEISNKSQLSIMKVEDKDISKYGIVNINKNNTLVSSLIEKPDQKKALSNFASIGRYILVPEVFSFLKKQNVGFGGEIQLSDSIHSMAVQGNVEAVHMQGKRFDCGSIEGYINAIKYMALKI